MSSSPRVLLAGYGRLGIRLARLLSIHGYGVTALSRRKPAGKGIQQAFAGDLTAPATLSGLDKGFDAIVYSPTPDKRDPDAYHEVFHNGLKNLLDRNTLKPDGRLMFVSSTAVYGQNDGSWIDESSATEPNRFNGKILLQAEQLARFTVETPSHQTTVFRLGGLYGDPNNYLVRQIINGSISIDNLDNWTNRIHLDDAAGLITHWLCNNLNDPVVNGVDHTPVLRVELLVWLVEKLREARSDDKFDALLKTLKQHQTNTANHTGKRISNNVARASGYDFQHPDFRYGYQSIVQAVKNQYF